MAVVICISGPPSILLQVQEKPSPTNGIQVMGSEDNAGELWLYSNDYRTSKRA